MALIFTPGSRAADRTVRVSLHVRLPDSTPIEGLAAALYTSSGQVAVGVSDASGVAVLDATVPDSVDNAVVAITGGHGDPEQRDRLAWKYDWLANNYCVVDVYRLHLPATQSDYTVSASILDCVEVTGTLVNGQGDALHAVAMTGCVYGFRFDSTPAQFKVRMQKLQAGRLFAAASPSPVDSSIACVVIKNLAARELQADTELDAITVSALADTGQAVLTAINIAQWQEATQDIFGPGFTLVSEDGQHIFSVAAKVQHANGVYLAYLGQSVAVPAGTYYVAPGLFVAEYYQTILIDAARSGTDASLQQLPKVTITAGGSTSLSIDALQVYGQIMSLTP